MSIRNKDKDQRSKSSPDETVLAEVLFDQPPTSRDSLVFWTNHATDNREVDLRVFATGQSERPNKGRGLWKGPFSGRPKLIAELAPHLKKRLQLLSPDSAKNAIDSLRQWWRLFDGLESRSSTEEFRSTFITIERQPIPVRVESVADLHALHEAAAHQEKFREKDFNLFLNVAEEARRATGQPGLAWISPQDGEPVRSIPDDQQAKQIKHAIKTDWRRVLETWQRNDRVVAEATTRLKGSVTPCEDAELDRLIANAMYYLRTQKRTGKEFPTGAEIRDSMVVSTFYRSGLNVTDMRGLMYPTARDADIAFHLCTLGSGWNPSTVGRLDAANPSLVRRHPKKEDVEVLESGDSDEDEPSEISSPKPRAGNDLQYCTGLLKDACSPPAIVRAFLGRTELLRNQLTERLKAAENSLKKCAKGGVDTDEYKELFVEVQHLRKGVRNVWLHLGEKGEILWIDGMRLVRYLEGGRGSRKFTYLEERVSKLNQDNAKRGMPELAPVVPSDFRDLYARWTYIKTGGNLLAVMLALGHKSIRSTQKYVDNNVFSDEIDEAYRRFAVSLLEELRIGRVDLTILTQLVRFGPLTPHLKERLDHYRKLHRSRTGVGCEAPRDPPRHIAPDHASGKFCGTQRCLLKCSNARFLPESLDGIAMRLEELLFLRDELPRQAWNGGNFEEEMLYAEALLGELFLPEVVESSRKELTCPQPVCQFLVSESKVAEVS